jgi:hypothetical protein
MPRNDVVDIPFDEAANVGGIRYRLAPIDVGFDLRVEKMHVAIARSDDPLRVSYGSRKGERRVVSGPQDAVLRHLRRHGYRFHAG